MRQKTIFFVALFCVLGWCFVSCESRNEPSPENEGSATFVGKPFSIAADKQVVFSPGNLQYIQSTKTWAFASQQYSFLGTANVVGAKKYQMVMFMEEVNPAKHWLIRLTSLVGVQIKVVLRGVLIFLPKKTIIEAFL
ncbi:MAG: hypothetical protein ACI30J_00455 [Paludibacteraceae bacterium]